MATKLFIKPHTLQFTIIPNKVFTPINKPKLSFFRLCTNSSTTETHSLFTHSLSYGPSLHKGTKPPPNTTLIQHEQDDENNNNVNVNVIDKDSFTRVFDVKALRVPSKDCFALESRLRGHLLNWPRIRNIARVPGDDIDEEIKTLLSDEDEDGEEGLVSLQRRIYGKAEGDGEGLNPVLYREKLAKEFNYRGFVKFRNLAKISRPKKRRKRREEGGERENGVRKNKFAVVEVVQDGEDGQDLRGLLGEGFKDGKWTGSTRLLLLDERYADRGVEELPEAIKAVLKEYTGECTKSTCELVKCKLTLFYDYWQMHEILEAILPQGVIIPSAFEMVGHIAHLNLRDEHLPYKRIIAQVVLDKNKPKIKTVVNKLDAISNDYRTMKLEILAGNHSLVTTVIESGLRFNIDLATVYWNSRLATERQRLVNGFTRDDVICDVFSGAGPIAISAAKIVKRVYANDLNPQAVEYLERNSVLNKLERKIEVFNMDGRRFINAMFTSEKAGSITQVIMNLPNDAAEYLDAFRGVLRDRPKDKKTKLPNIHVYGFSKAPDPEFDFHERIRIALSEVAVDVKMRRVRLVAPGKWMLCASFILPESVAFGKPTLDL